MLTRAVIYRIGSIIISTAVAWILLAALRDTAWSTGAISILTSCVLFFTNTAYYIIFHKIHKRLTNDRP